MKYEGGNLFGQISSSQAHGRMEFEKTIQGALKTLRTSLEQHEAQILGYERTIARLNELTKNVPRDSKVHAPFLFLLIKIASSW
jgi:hypothetical protein